MDCVGFYYDAQFSTGNESNNATKKIKPRTKRKIDQFQQLIDSIFPEKRDEMWWIIWYQDQNIIAMVTVQGTCLSFVVKIELQLIL